MVPATPAGDMEVAPAHPGRDVGSSPLPSPPIAARSGQQQIDAARSSSSHRDNVLAWANKLAIVISDGFPFGSTRSEFIDDDLLVPTFKAANIRYYGRYGSSFSPCHALAALHAKQGIVTDGFPFESPIRLKPIVDLNLEGVKVTANNKSYYVPYGPILIKPETVRVSVVKAAHADWPSAIISPMMSGGSSPPSRPSSAASPNMTTTDLAAGNYSGTPPPPRTPTPLTERSVGIEQGFTSSNPDSPPPPGGSSGDGDNEGPHLTFVLALLAYIAGVMIGILPESDHIVAGWSTVARVVYGIVVQLTVALLAVGIMSAGCHAARNNRRTSVSAWCAKLGAILSSVLLVVAFSCKLGRCVAAAPSAAAIAAVMAAAWIWGDERAAAEAIYACWGRVVVGPRRRRQQPAAGDEMV